MILLKRIHVIVALALLGSVICAAQLKIHSFEKAEVLQKSENRPVVVFIYTDWCAYCQAMKNTAFIDRQIAKKLNDQFYFVALNGEENGASGSIIIGSGINPTELIQELMNWQRHWEPLIRNWLIRHW